MTADNKHLIGRKLISAHADVEAVFEIVAILPPEDLAGIREFGDRMTLRDLTDDYEGSAHWVSEIGKDFFLIPENYPRDRLDFLIKWMSETKQAHEIHMELLGFGLEKN